MLPSHMNSWKQKNSNSPFDVHVVIVPNLAQRYCHEPIKRALLCTYTNCTCMYIRQCMVVYRIGINSRNPCQQIPAARNAREEVKGRTFTAALQSLMHQNINPWPAK